ncbi:MAG: GTPase Era [Bryobacteraceae bacterium]
MSKFVSGFVSILGLPNAGKSTLLTALIGSKIAIVTDKPQTTRTALQGVLTLPDAQIVFLDTPGIHRSSSPINKRMMESVRAALNERDLLLFVVDASQPFGENDKRAVALLQNALLQKSEAPVILLFNKTDLLRDKGALLPLIEEYRTLYGFAEYLPISARDAQGLDAVREAVIARLPEGPAYFPPDHVTDQPERFIAAELIREKILIETRQEVPHSIAVLIDKWERTPEITRIYATIYVEKDGQKGIVIGAGGAMLKKTGTLARREIEELFGVKVFLDLHVKVQPDWREKPAFLNTLDWRTMAGSNE